MMTDTKERSFVATKFNVLNYQIPIPPLTPEEIEEFRQITKKVKGIDLTIEEAEDQATRYVKLVRLISENNPCKIEKEDVK